MAVAYLLLALVLVATNRNNTIAIELELQPAHCLAECASPENCAQHGHGVTPDPAVTSNSDETLKKERETFYRAETSPVGATDAFSRRPLSSASRSFALLILRGSNGSIPLVRQVVGGRPVFAHLRPLSNVSNRRTPDIADRLRTSQLGG